MASHPCSEFIPHAFVPDKCRECRRPAASHTNVHVDPPRDVTRARGATSTDTTVHRRGPRQEAKRPFTVSQRSSTRPVVPRETNINPSAPPASYHAATTPPLPASSSNASQGISSRHVAPLPPARLSSKHEPSQPGSALSGSLILSLDPNSDSKKIRFSSARNALRQALSRNSSGELSHLWFPADQRPPPPLPRPSTPPRHTEEDRSRSLTTTNAPEDGSAVLASNDSQSSYPRPERKRRSTTGNGRGSFERFFQSHPSHHHMIGAPPSVSSPSHARAQRVASPYYDGPAKLIRRDLTEVDMLESLRRQQYDLMAAKQLQNQSTFSSTMVHKSAEIVNQVEAGIYTLKRVRGFFKKYCHIQGEYHKALHRAIQEEKEKLASATHPDRMATCWRTWVATLEQMDMMNEAHGEFATELADAVYDPLDMFYVVGSRRTNEVIAELHQGEREVTDLGKIANKKKQQAGKLLQEWQARVEAYETSEQRTKSKAERQMEKAREKVLRASERYDLARRELNQTAESYYNVNLPHALDEMQVVEEMRTHNIKLHLSNFSVLQREYVTEMKNISERIAEIANGLQPHQDLEYFIAHFQSVHGDPPKYEPDNYDLPFSLAQLESRDGSSPNVFNSTLSETLLAQEALSSSSRVRTVRPVRPDWPNDGLDNKHSGVSTSAGAAGSDDDDARSDTSEEDYRGLPKILVRMADAMIALGGLTIEGIFRISPSTAQVAVLRDNILNDNYSIISPDPHLYAAMMKFWLRGLPQSLIPTRLYQRCIEMGQTVLPWESQVVTNMSAFPTIQHKRSTTLLRKRYAPGDDGSSVGAGSSMFASNESEEDASTQALSRDLQQLLNEIAAVNHRVLQYVISLLRQVATHQDENKMSISNLAIIFAPSILRDPENDPMVLFRNTKHAAQFVVHLCELDCL